MACEFKVECLLGTTDEVVFLLDAIEFALKDIDGVHCRVDAQVSLDGTCLLPLLQYVVYFVFCDDFELESSCARMRQVMISLGMIAFVMNAHLVALDWSRSSS